MGCSASVHVTAASPTALKANDTATGTVVCKVFVGNTAASTLPFPEMSDGDLGIPALLEKPNFGVCISGGGMRASTCGLGVLRALHHLGLLSKARYLSTTSGGSWLNGAFSFQAASSLDEFLGPYVPPEALTVEATSALGAERRSYATVLADAEPLRKVIGEVLANLVQVDWDDNAARGWTKGIAGAYLAPFGVGDHEKSTVTVMGTRGGVHARVGEAAKRLGLSVYPAMRETTMPFPIMTMAVLQPNDKMLFFPAEWTPLYAGVPVPVRLGAEGPQQHLYGGGWVEPLGLNTRLGPDDKPKAAPVGPQGGEVTLHRAGPATLAEAVGISSAYLSYKMAKGKNTKEQNLHKIVGGSTLQYWDMQEWRNAEVQFTDGAGTDALGLHPLLRRKVAKILSFCACRFDPKDQHGWASNLDEVSSLFGRFPGRDGDKIPISDYNATRKVFDSAGWDALWQDVSAKYQAGGPVYHRVKYSVLENRFLGVPGGWEVEVMFVFNCTQARWEASLPGETKSMLQDDKSDFMAKAGETIAVNFVDTSLREFPLIDTQATNYRPELVGMLANHAAWTVVSLQDELRGMIAAATASS